MTANEHLQPALFDAGERLSAAQNDMREHARMGRQVAAFGDLAVSMPLDAATRVAETGSIRTQHETGRSEGAFEPRMRGDLEGEMGYAHNPVYGYLRRAPSEDPPYGKADFHLKPEVKQRTYMWPGDSLNHYVDDVIPETSLVADVTAGRAKAPHPVDGTDYASTEYVEAHILPDTRPETMGGKHGETSRVPLEDVRKVSLHEGDLRFDISATSRDFNRPRNFKIGQGIEDAGIPVEHVLTDQIEQPPLPMEYRDGPPPSTKFGTRSRVVRHQDMGGRDRWGGA